MTYLVQNAVVDDEEIALVHVCLRNPEEQSKGRYFQGLARGVRKCQRTPISPPSCAIRGALLQAPPEAITGSHLPLKILHGTRKRWVDCESNVV